MTMLPEPVHLITFEHQSLRLGQRIGNHEFTETVLFALQKYYGSAGVPYYDLIHQGVRFKEFVGVIKVGNTIIEVLPKADRKKPDESLKTQWQQILLGMLKAVYSFEIHSTSESALKIKPNSILDLYFELFIREVEYLLHLGLIKRYRRCECNAYSLKGSLHFARNLQQNLIHQERFYVRYTHYDQEHLLHKILYKTIRLIKKLNTHGSLSTRIESLLFNFPEMPYIPVSSTTFDRIHYHRKTKAYENAIAIARILLLQYHPDLSRGREDVLALMFDMNLLWEKFVYLSLKKYMKSAVVSAQNIRYFWRPDLGQRRTIRPDIRINSQGHNFILDTKWKMSEGKPSMDDIRQMYVYHQYFQADKVALVYPGEEQAISGRFMEINNHHQPGGQQCGLLFIKPIPDIRIWQKEIAEKVGEWMVD